MSTTPFRGTSHRYQHTRRWLEGSWQRVGTRCSRLGIPVGAEYSGRRRPHLRPSRARPRHRPPRCCLLLHLRRRPHSLRTATIRGEQMTPKDTHDQGTTNRHPGHKPPKTSPLQRSEQGTTNRQPTDTTRRPTKGQVSPLYRGRLSPGHEFQTPKTITACPGQTGHPKSKITTATHTGQAVAPSGTYPRARHTGTDTGLRGHTHAVPDRASPQAT